MNLIPWRGKRSEGELGQSGGPGGPGGPGNLLQLRQEMDRLFDQFTTGFFGGGPMGLGFGTTGEIGGQAGAGLWMPPIDISESDNEVVVRAEIPGVDPENVDVSVTGSTLAISGEKEETEENSDRNYFRSERRFGSFERRIQLPEYVDADNVNAEFHNGVLTVTLAKHEAKRPRQIPVSSGEQTPGASRRR